jgi:MFS family permease
MTPTEALTARRAVAAMFAANGALMGAWAPQIPLLLPRHDITESVLGLLILVLGLGAVSAMLFAGRLIAAKGSVPVLKLFALASLPVLALVVYAPSLWALTPAMALFGALIGCMDVAMNANAVEVERRLGRAIMSSSHGFWSLGGFVGGTIGSWLIVQVGAGMQALLITAAVALMVLLALPHLRGEPPHASPAEAGPRPAILPRDAALWVLGAMALFSMVPEGAVLDWAALYLGKELTATPFVAGLGFALFSGAMAIMRFAGDAVRNRFGAVNTLRVSGLLGAGGMMIAAAAPHPYLALFGFALSGLGVANMVPIMFSAAGNWPGHAAGAAISTVTMVGYAGILIAPSSIGWLAEHIGFRPTYAGLSLLLLVVTLNAGRAATADDLRQHSPAE